MKSESIKQDTCTYVLTVSGKQPLFSVGHWQNVCKKLAGILIFFYLEENRSNKSDELAALGKFLIFVDDELEKEKREKGRKRASAASSKDRRRRREGEESNAFPTKPCMWFLLARCISCCIFKNTILWREAPHVLGVPVPVDLPHSNGSSRPAKNIFSSKIDLQYLPVQS